MPISSILGPLIGAGAGFLASERAGEDRQKAARINQETERERIASAKAQPLGRNVTTGTDVTAKPGGGFNIGFIPGSSQEEASGATGTRSAPTGNVLRQQLATNLAGTSTAPTTEQINLAFDERDQLRQRDLDFGLNQILSQRQRLGQGIQPPNSPFEGRSIDAIRRFAEANRKNTSIEKLLARSEFDQKAANLQTTQLANLADRGITPVGTPGANLAQLITNQPRTPTPTDFSGLTNLAVAGGGLVQDFEKQRLAASEEEKFNKVLAALRERTVGPSGSGTFGRTT